MPRTLARHARALGLACLLAAAHPACGEEPVRAVAFVTQLQGHAEAGAPPRAISILSALRLGERLRLQEGAQVTLAFPGADGSVVMVSGPGAFLLAPAGVRAEPGTAARAISVRDLAAPLRALRVDPEGAARAGVSMRAGSARRAGASPASAQFPEDVRALCWPAAPPAATLSAVAAGPGAAPGQIHYEVELVDDAGTRIFTARSEGTCAPLPADFAPAPGQAYVWTVSASRRGRREQRMDVEFRVPGADDLARARLAIAALGDGSTRSESMVLSLGLARMGLLDRARASAISATDTALRFDALEAPARWRSAW